MCRAGKWEELWVAFADRRIMACTCCAALAFTLAVLLRHVPLNVMILVAWVTFRTPAWDALGAAWARRREAGDEMPMDIVPERCGYREGRCQFRNPPAARVLLSVGAGHVADYK